MAFRRAVAVGRGVGRSLTRRGVRRTAVRFNAGTSSGRGSHTLGRDVGWGVVSHV